MNSYYYESRPSGLGVAGLLIDRPNLSAEECFQSAACDMDMVCVGQCDQTESPRRREHHRDFGFEPVKCGGSSPPWKMSGQYERSYSTALEEANCQLLASSIEARGRSETLRFPIRIRGHNKRPGPVARRLRPATGPHGGETAQKGTGPRRKWFGDQSPGPNSPQDELNWTVCCWKDSLPRRSDGGSPCRVPSSSGQSPIGICGTKELFIPVCGKEASSLQTTTQHGLPDGSMQAVRSIIFSA